jgi:hypothetical protein
MRKPLFAAVVLIIALPNSSAGSREQKPTKNTERLTLDEVAIYKAVLQQYAGDDSDKLGTLNVSAATYSLDPDSAMIRLSGNACLEGIHLDNLATASRSFHDLTPDILPSKHARLVDPKKQKKIVHDNDPHKTMQEGKSVEGAVNDAFSTALFSMSEIAFDKGHTYAVVSYSFWCGSLCGNGGTWVFQKIRNQWKKTDRDCGGWIS